MGQCLLCQTFDHSQSPCIICGEPCCQNHHGDWDLDPLKTPVYWCESCCEIGKEFKQRYKDEWVRHDVALQVIFLQWKTFVLEAK